MSNKIVVQCARDNNTHAQITVLAHGLYVGYGKAFNYSHFVAITYERFDFGQYPELRELYDGIAWNPEALAAFTYVNLEKEPAVEALAAEFYAQDQAVAELS